MSKSTHKTTTGDSVRYGGRFRYIVVSRAWEREYEIDEHGIGCYRAVRNPDGTFARTDWVIRKRTDSIETATKEVNRARFRGVADVEVIDTVTGRAASC